MDICKLFSTSRFHATLLLASTGMSLVSEAALPVAEPDSKTVVSFQKDILPILRNNCLPCHNKTRAKAEIMLETPADIFKGNDDGPLVVPGKPDESYLFLVSAHIEEDSIMPPAKNKVSAKNLTPRELGLMSLWIKQGAKGDAKVDQKLEWQTVKTNVHNPIFAVALSDDGQFVASGRSNRVDLYHIPTGTHIGELSDEKLGTKLYTKHPAHLDYVTAAAFSPDNQTIATGSFREVKLWKLQAPSSKAVAKLNGFTGQGSVSADGQWFASGQGQEVVITNLQSGKEHKKLAAKAEVSAVGFSQDGSIVAAGTANGDVLAWKVNSGEVVATANLAEKPVTTVSVLQEPIRVLSAHNDNIIRVWEAPESKEEPQWKMAREMKLHSKPVSNIVPHPTNQAYVFTAGADGQVALWDASKGQNLKKVAHSGGVVDLTIQPNGEQFVSVGGNIARLWSKDWKQIAELKGNRDVQSDYDTKVRTLAFVASEVKYREAQLKKAKDDDKKAQDRLKKAQEAKEKAAKEPVAEKKAELEKQEQERDKLEKEVATLEETAAKSKEKVDKLLAERKKAETEYKAAQNALKAPTTAETQAKTANDQKKRTLDQKQQARDAVQKTKLQPKQDQLNALAPKIDAAKKNQAAAQKELEAAGEDEAKKKAAQDKLNKFKGELANLDKQQADLKTAVAAAEKELKTADDGLNAAKKDHDAAQKKYTAAKATADKARMKNEDAKIKFDGINKTYTDENAAYSKLQKDKLAPAKKKFADLQKKIDTDRKEFDKINGPVQTAIRELANAEQDIERTKKELAEAEKSKTDEDERNTAATAERDKAKEAVDAVKYALLSASFSQDGNFVYTLGDDKKIHAWSASTGAPCFVHKEQGKQNSILGASKSGGILTVSPEGEIQSWDLALKFKLAKLIGSALGKSPMVSRVTSLDIDPSGTKLAIGGGDPSRTGELITWDLKAGKLLKKYEDVHSDTVLDLEFSPKGNQIASGSSDKFVKVIEADTGKVLRSFEGHTHHVLGVSWRRTGRELVSSGADNDIKYWNVENGDRLGKGGGFSKEVTSVHAIGISNQAIVTGAQGNVSLITLGTSIRKSSDFPGATKYTHVSDVTEDDKFVAAGGQDGILRIWTVADRKLLREFKPIIEEAAESLAENK